MNLPRKKGNKKTVFNTMDYTMQLNLAKASNNFFNP